MANVMRIAAQLERWYADGNYSYQPGLVRCSDGASSTFSTTDGLIGGSLPIAVKGDAYRYRVVVYDRNDDDLCESYTITAEGVAHPVKDDVLTLDSLGQKTGDW